MDQHIRFCTTRDDVRIAFYALGEGAPLVYSPPWPFGHIQLEWQNRRLRTSFENLAENHWLVRYDGRGAGLSDREVKDYGVEAQILDLEAVVERLGLHRFALFAFGHMGPAYISYAARNPARVSHLILWMSWAKYSDYGDSQRVKAAWSLIERDWEMYTEMEGYRATEWQGGPAAKRYTDFLRQCVSPTGLAAALQALQGIDVRPLLPQIDMPTLVMHRAGSHVMSIDVAKDLAARIPNAELAVMDGPWRSPFHGDAGPALKRIDTFLQSAPPPGPEGLTPREVEGLTPREVDVLRLIASGRTNREIAAELVLSPRTVGRHITNIYGKIGARGKADATAYALQHELNQP